MKIRRKRKASPPKSESEQLPSRIAFVLRHYAGKNAGAARGFLRRVMNSPTQGTVLTLHDAYLGQTDNTAMSDDVLKALEEAEIIERGKLCMDHSTRAFLGLQYGKKRFPQYAPHRAFTWSKGPSWVRILSWLKDSVE